MKIAFLDSHTAAKIAAGEVITDPAAAVKELVENSIDAGAKDIRIEIEDGGKRLIRVIDDGEGINEADVFNAFERHATSKIKKIDDLDNLETLGFRGEALASMAAISKVYLRTSDSDDGLGTYVRLSEGKREKRAISYKKGTSISIEELFFNTPARLKHMKKPGEENKKVIQMVQVLAMSHPEVSFSLVLDGSQALKTPGKGDLENTLRSLFGEKFDQALFKADYKNAPMEIKGFLGNPYYTKKNRDYQFVFVNNRYVKEIKINKAIEDAYDNTVMINQHPVFILNIKLPSDMLDVNIHPAKTKIKILNESLVMLLLKSGVRKIIRENLAEKKSNGDSKETNREKSYFKFEDNSADVISVEEMNISKFEVDQRQSNVFLSNKENKEVLTEDTVLENPIDRIKAIEKANEPSKIEALFKNAKLVGQLFKTYILLEKPGEQIVLIDQHAAHERIIFEKITEDIKSSKKTTQSIIPLKLKLLPDKYEFLKQNSEVFAKLGFDYDEFGENSIVVRGVPCLLDEPAEPELLIKILDDFNDGKIEELETKIIISACKKAVKGNQYLDASEINELLDLLKKCNMPFTCPHGRPVAMSMTKYEMEKLFKRIV
ncbi:MAG TPA: DNA mismatch repair endonuclease MutL [Eubacteriaceae bacterium]|jgi:DNA mismatch repair protein MutL|nr:DNA mismatch repair endonuclease MutL [Eubacteriaceae bacterium]